MKKDKMIMLQVWVYPAQKQAVKDYSKKQGETQSWVVRQLIDLNLK